LTRKKKSSKDSEKGKVKRSAPKKFRGLEEKEKVTGVVRSWETWPVRGFCVAGKQEGKASSATQQLNARGRG